MSRHLPNAETAQDQDDRARINAEAAAWHVRFENGEVDESDSAYLDWLAAAPEHRDAMARAQAVSYLFAGQAAAPEIVKMRRDALHRSARTAAGRWAVFRLGGKRWAAAGLAACAVALIVAPIAYQTASGPDPAETIVAAAQSYETGIAETRTVTLADNSRVSLDATTQIEVAYGPEARDIELLRGQAHFDVAHDPMRPFRVTAGDQTVIATGTAFNVEMVGDQVLVTLLEGEVVVRETAPSGGENTPEAPDVVAPERVPSITLSPGQQLSARRRADAAPSVPMVDETANLEKANAWRQGRVFLDGDSLGSAVARMNRYSRIRISVADDALEELRMSGVFNAGDTDAFIEAVESYFPVDAHRLSASSIELRARG